MTAHSLTVTDPAYRGRVLISHEGLSGRDVEELRLAYVALGYPDESLQVGGK